MKMRFLVLLLRLALLICTAVAQVMSPPNQVLSLHQVNMSHEQRVLMSLSLLGSICRHTPHPDVCNGELQDFHNNVLTASPLDVSVYALTAVTRRIDEAHNLATNCSKKKGLTVLEGQCANICVELMSNADDQMKLAVARLSELPRVTDMVSLRSALMDVKVWLSSSLSYQMACSDNFHMAPGSIQEQILSNQEYLGNVMGMSLSLVNILSQLGNDLAAWLGGLLPPSSPPAPTPKLGHRRLLSAAADIKSIEKIGAPDFHPIVDEDVLPGWVPSLGRQILQSSASGLAASADVVVTKDGSGTYPNISAALKGIPGNYSGRYVIYIKRGVYKEVLDVTTNQQNITFVGDGIDKTIITGNRNVASGNYSTYSTATVGISGSGFYARAITFRNTAGPSRQQAVAMRAGADYMIFYQCGFKGYQDTLYALSSRQFYRECKIYGTVDFIFGNAIAVFQRCELLARLPMKGQQNTYTAQGRKLESDISGYSFQNCTLTADASLKNVNYSVSTYLGRPWKAYSRVVFIQSDLKAVIDPKGWLSWNSSNPFTNTVYYGEYNNSGGGSNTSMRVGWAGVHPKMLLADASQFTVSNFIAGKSWLDVLQVPYQAGL